MDSTTNTLNYSQENINELEAKGYRKSSISKPYSNGKVLRYSPKRGVYWFSSRRSAHNSDCFFTRQRVGQIILI
jgi:hypothetical protein